MKKIISYIKPIFCLLLLLLSLQVFSEQQVSNQERFEALTSQLRCLVCQNESLNDSTAPLAVDLKKQVWNMMRQGKSNQEIISFLTDRYGEFVLFKPSFSAKNYVLWLGPLLLLLIAFAWFGYALKQRKSHMETTLTDEEKQRLEQLLK